MKHSFLLKLYAVIVVFLIIDWFLPDGFRFFILNGYPSVKYWIGVSTIIGSVVLTSAWAYLETKSINKMAHVGVATFGVLIFPLVVTPTIILVVATVVSFLLALVSFLFSATISLSVIVAWIVLIISTIIMLASWGFVAYLAYLRYRIN